MRTVTSFLAIVLLCCHTLAAQSIKNDTIQSDNFLHNIIKKETVWKGVSIITVHSIGINKVLRTITDFFISER